MTTDPPRGRDDLGGRPTDSGAAPWSPAALRSVPAEGRRSRPPSFLIPWSAVDLVECCVGRRGHDAATDACRQRGADGADSPSTGLPARSVEAGPEVAAGARLYQRPDAGSCAA